MSGEETTQAAVSNPSDGFTIGRLIVGTIVFMILGTCSVRLVSDTLSPLTASTSIASANSSATVLIVTQALFYSPLLAVGSFVIPWVARRSYFELGLRIPVARDLVIAVASAALIIASDSSIRAMTEVVADKMASRSVEPALTSPPSDPKLILGLFLLTSIFSPVMEETFFRGFIFNALRHYTAPAVAVVISAAIFAVGHAEPTEFFPLLATGAILAAVYERTRSLTIVVLGHGLVNTVYLASSLVFHPG